MLASKLGGFTDTIIETIIIEYNIGLHSCVIEILNII